MSTTIRPKKNNNPKSRIKWGLSLAWAPLSPSPVILLSFMMLFSSSHCCSSFCTIALFTLLLFFRPTVLLIVLLLSFSPCCFLLALFSFPLHAIAFLQLFFHFRYKVLHVVIILFTLFVLFIVFLLLVCFYLLKNLVLPRAFFLTRIGSGWESIIENLYFFSKYFLLCLFLFFNFFNFMSFVFFLFFVLIFLAFGLWCKACYKLFWR